MESTGTDAQQAYVNDRKEIFMILTKEQYAEFEEAVRPLMKLMARYHPAHNNHCDERNGRTCRRDCRCSDG